MSRIKESQVSKPTAHDRSRGTGTPQSNGRGREQPAGAPGRHAVAELRLSAQHAVQSMKDGLGDASELIRSKYEGARNTASGATESLKGRIGRHPVTAIGIAAGAGVVIGLLLRRVRR